MYWRNNLVHVFFFFSSRRRHTSWTGDWSSDVCSSDLTGDHLLRTRGLDHGEPGGHRNPRPALASALARARRLRNAVFDLPAVELLPGPPERPVRVRRDRRRGHADHVLPAGAPALRAGACIAGDLPVSVGVERPARGPDLRR